jgi:acyl carrier protein phosphodiesterase
MNFIAHLILSPKEKHYLSGNIAADFLDGFSRKRISAPIQSGITMHQFVDRYTDTHPIVKTSRDRINSHFRLLSGVLIDVFYDHFLARNFSRIASVSLKEFCRYIYETLEQNITELPPRLQRFVPIMIREDILYSYRELAGIQLSLDRINRRITLKIATDLATAVLKDHYDRLEADFMSFFPCVITATEHYRDSYDSFLI